MSGMWSKPRPLGRCIPEHIQSLRHKDFVMVQMLK